MPLPGGPSDKAGNQFERHWTVRCLVDLLRGEASSIRLEPPGEHSIEFRLTRSTCTEVHQAKRGNRTEGRWAISDLTATLASFSDHLGADDDVKCIFVSADTAPVITELADRARRAETYTEFQNSFLATSQDLRKGIDSIQKLWSLTAHETWERVRRIFIETTSDSRLTGEIDAILGEMYDAKPSTTRAVLSQLTSDSTHKTLMPQDIEAALTQGGITRRQPRLERISLDIICPPEPLPLYGRDALLAQLTDALREATTVFIGGLPGMGKTSLAATISSNWGADRTVWIDCDMTNDLNSISQLLSEYALNSIKSPTYKNLAPEHRSPKALGRTLGKLFGQHKTLIVWDGFSSTRDHGLQSLIEEFDRSLGSGRQMITEQEHGTDWSLPTAKLVDAPPLSLPESITFLCAFGVNDLTMCQAIWRHTGGHPYLLRMAISLRTISHLEELVIPTGVSPSSSSTWFAKQILSTLSESQSCLLAELSAFRGPFHGTVAAKWAAVPEDIASLKQSFLLLPTTAGRYKIHETIRENMLASIKPERAKNAHEHAYKELQGRNSLTAADVKEMVYQAISAGLAHQAEGLITRFLNAATHAGEWTEAFNCSNLLTLTPESRDWFIPHFVKGRALRFAGRKAEALVSYQNAERLATDPGLASTAIYEQAAVKYELGEFEESSSLYERLAAQGTPSAAAGAHAALCLIAGQNDNLRRATEHYNAALAIAESNGLAREAASAKQSMGDALLRANNHTGALRHLREAVAIRRSLAQEYGGNDMLALYHLLQNISKAESRSGQQIDAACTAEEQLQIAFLTNNPMKVAESLWSITELAGASDGRATSARKKFLEALTSCAPDDYPDAQVYSLVLKSSWLAHEYEASFEVLFEGLRASDFQGREFPTFMNVSADSLNITATSNVHELDSGVCLLIVPASWAPSDVEVIARRIMARRPDLAPFVVGMFAKKGELQPSRREGSPRKMRPNDLCHCGSGKKYKRCCGRK